MNDYSSLAQHLAARKTGQAPPAGTLNDLKSFLNTSAGRDATRGVIDSVIARNKTVGEEPDTHKAILSALMQMMNGTQP